MQISLNIRDDVYQKLMSTGIDMQAKVNEYLLSLVDKKESGGDLKKFEEDKAYFHTVLSDIESGKVKPLSHDEVWRKIEEEAK